MTHNHQAIIESFATVLNQPLWFTRIAFVVPSSNASRNMTSGPQFPRELIAALPERARGHVAREIEAFHADSGTYIRAAGDRLFHRSMPGVGLPEIPTVALAHKDQKLVASTDALFASVTANAGPQRDRFKIYPATNLTPITVGAMLKQADIGIMYRWQEAILQTLKRDARLAGVHRGMRDSISGRPFTVRPTPVSNPDDRPIARAMADFVTECLDGMSGFKRAMAYLLLAPCAGYSVVEPVYRYRRVCFPWNGSPVSFTALSLDDLRRVYGRHFQFNTDNNLDRPVDDIGPVLQIDGQTPLLNVGHGVVYLPRHKFVFHTGSDEGQIQERGWMRTAIWLSMLKQRVISLWVEFINRFGVPNVRGSVPFNIWADQARSLKYQRFLTLFGEGLATLFPDDLKISVDQYQPGGTSRDAFASFIGWIDTQLTILVQGEHLTTEIGDVGSYGATAEQAHEKQDVIQANDSALDETIRDQLFYSLIDLNKEELSLHLGVPPEKLLACRPIPVFRLDARTSRKERLEEADIYINKLGGRIRPEQLEAETGFDPVGDGDDFLPGSGEVVAAGAALVHATSGQVRRNPSQDPGAKISDPPPVKKTASRGTRKKPHHPS